MPYRTERHKTEGRNIILAIVIMTKHKTIRDSLKLIFQGIEGLKEGFENRRQFTIDGRLVGDIGEVIAELEYDITIDKISQPGYDGTTSDGKRVQVKATFKNSLTFSSVPDLYLGLKLNEDGTFEEIYNGPGHHIGTRYKHRRGLGENLLSFPIGELKKLQLLVGPHEKIRRRG